MSTQTIIASQYIPSTAAFRCLDCKGITDNHEACPRCASRALVPEDRFYESTYSDDYTVTEIQFRDIPETKRSADLPADSWFYRPASVVHSGS